MCKSAAITCPIARHAARIPDQLAVIDGDQVVTYAALELRIADTVRALRAAGCRGGDRVAIAAANSPAWIVTAHALPRIGAVLLPLDLRMRSHEWKQALEQFTPALVLVDDAGWENAAPSRRAATRLMRVEEIAPSDVSSSSPDADETRSRFESIDPHALHSLVLTSGTTGTPRGVRLSFANHLFSALASGLNLGIEPEDRWLLNLPLHHVGGLAVAFRAACYGTAIVIARSFDVADAIRAIEDHRVTQLSLVNTTLRRLLAGYPKATFPAWIRSVLVGGGPVDSALLAEAHARGLPVLPTYGMTETASQVATPSPSRGQDELRLTGQPLAFCELEIRDERGEAVPSGTEGTIWVRGPMVSEGYWLTADRTDDVRVDGWFETRDIGALDDENNLIVRGRRDTAIITGGEKVYPEDIEGVLGQLPGIRRAAVFGIDDPRWGQAVVALVESDSSEAIDRAAVKKLAADRIAPFKLPRQIRVVAQLPTTRLGKIDRAALAALWRALGDGVRI